MVDKEASSIAALYCATNWVAEGEVTFRPIEPLLPQ